MKQAELQAELERLYGTGNVVLAEKLDVTADGQPEVVAMATVSISVGQRLRSLDELEAYREGALAALRAARLVSLWAVKLDEAREAGNESVQAEAVAHLVHFGAELRRLEGRTRAAYEQAQKQAS